MRKLIAGVAAASLLVGCGQRSGIHEQFVPQYRQAVAEDTSAHGASARTRHSEKRQTITVEPERVPGGRRILKVAPPSGGVVTWPQWGALLLDRLRAPRCANNLIVVVAWAAQEGTRAGWNPLATTIDMAGATLFNSAGVKNYASLEQGLQATVLTLQKGFHEHGYGAIVQDLRACADPLVTAAAVNASDWCSGCAGGAYLLAVVPRVIDAYVSSLRQES